MFVFLGFVLVGFFIGILIGWVWKPNWVSFGDRLLDGFVVRNQVVEVESHPSPNQNQNRQLVQVGTNLDYGSSRVDRKFDDPSCSSSLVKKEEDYVLKDEDLKHLWQLVEKKDGGPPWKHMMDRSTSAMTYQAWQRDPENGPPQYCSITVYEDATPELLRDFFWDDDLRLKWDDMLLHATTLEEFPAIGASVMHWIRRFPFFCSDREYIIGRRMWELERSFYCVTKGVTCPSVPRKQKPRRVDLYYSSWFIRSATYSCHIIATFDVRYIQMAVNSKKGENQSACEVTFFHHEDMGIPREIVKFGIKQGMWGTAKKIEQGLRWYQKERSSLKTPSHHITMAQMSTKIDQSYLTRLESADDENEPRTEIDDENEPRTEMTDHEHKEGSNMTKLLLIAGAVIFACTFDRGLLTKAVIFRVARRFGNLGRQAFPPT